MDDHEQLVLRLKKLSKNDKVKSDPVLSEITSLLLNISDPNYKNTQKKSVSLFRHIKNYYECTMENTVSKK